MLVNSLRKIQSFIKLQNITFHVRSYSNGPSNIRVTICGALGQVGQPLALLLKSVPEINELCLYDIKRTRAYAMELNLIDTNCRVIGCDGFGKESEIFMNTDIVVIAAARPGTNAEEPEEMFEINKSIICRLCHVISVNCPKAFVAVVTQPINSFVPLVSEQLRASGIYNPRKVFGVTTLNSLRANSVAANLLELKPENVSIPVVGGAYGKTIIPIPSTVKKVADICHEEIETIVKAVQKAHRRVVEAKGGCNGPTFSGAVATMRFVRTLIRALKGEKNVIDTAFVRSNIVDDLRYLSSPVMIGREGIEKNYVLPCMTLYEHDVLIEGVELLKDDIIMGEKAAGIDYEEICKDGNCGFLCPQHDCEVVIDLKEKHKESVEN